MDSFSGGCACGQVRYTCTGKVLYMGNCHCRDCQRATGSGYFPAVLVKNEFLELGSRSMCWYESQADRGHPMMRGFCSRCGSPVALKNGANDGVTVLYAGSLDDPSWYAPSRNIFVSSAQPWVVMDPDLPKHEAMPG
jgi:hypothetical protein